ncbi:protein FAR1-RELATED SEQUENCE 11-like isoform X2 [Argentina anserina]|uniref:protein FAR1-RELATED SEQUENCE 11-like isoform X2 n=1 Tax=Argentina anserina TaxID=57926 RepID=UPI002176777F|nr:protein FAR1-RELATED SEQUENCE 11-like isoform X2 [Potentilla anserina]
MSEGTSNGMDDMSRDDAGTVGETAENCILSRQTSVNLVPVVGQRFSSQDAAYEFYCGFALQCGFSIRRHRTRGKDGVGKGVTRRDFTCHRGGYPQVKPSEDGKMQRNRKSSRCGCKAYMRIVKRTEFDAPEWRVTGFSNVHNHELLRSNEVSLFPASCSISPDDMSRICMYAKAGMSERQMLRLMELEKGVKLGCLSFTEIDVRNLLQSFRNVHRDRPDGDAIDLLAMCKKMKDENPDFRYDFKIDGHNRLEHIAWSYGSSIRLYEEFGDAVVFDTTYRLDAYDMLLGIWLGVNNHGMTCFFGCVLLRDENMQSFFWALKTFRGFMKGKTPQTILTDHNMWLKEAIAVVMPQTRHAFCIWYIVDKFSEWFCALLGSQYDDWKTNFEKLYNLQSVEEFEERWMEMVDRYGLHANKHVISLYALRSFWALAYMRPYFFAGMTNTCYSDSTGAFIQRFLSAVSQLDRFVEQAADIVNYSDRAGAKQKLQQKLQRVCLKTGSPIESHAASVLTSYAFGKLQEELVLAPQYASLPVDEVCFQVRHHTQADGGCKVFWVPSQEHISCTCCEFEFTGILCRHILRVLSNGNCFRIPDRYLAARWCGFSSSSTNSFQNAKDKSEKIQLLESMASTLVAESIETDERLHAAYDQIAVALSRVKDLPSTTRKAIEGASDCSPDFRPHDLMSLPEVEVDDGVVRFAMGNSHESVSSGKLKERRPKETVESNRKRTRHCAGPCCLSDL